MLVGWSLIPKGRGDLGVEAPAKTCNCKLKLQSNRRSYAATWRMQTSDSAFYQTTLVLVDGLVRSTTGCKFVVSPQLVGCAARSCTINRQQIAASGVWAEADDVQSLGAAIDDCICNYDTD